MRKNRSRTAIDRQQRTYRGMVWVGGFGLAVLLVGWFFFDEMGVPKYLEMQRRAQGLQQEIQDLERTNTDLKAEIVRLQKDPAKLEEVARERLGFVRKGETVYQVLEAPAKAGKAEPGR